MAHDWSQVKGVPANVQPHAARFSVALAYGTKLVRLLVNSGWSPTYFKTAPERAEEIGWRQADFPGWVVRARPPRTVANAFDLPVEVLFYCTTFQDLQARTVENVRDLVSRDPRTSREVAFIVLLDDECDWKIKQIPDSYGVIPLSLTWLQDAVVAPDTERPLHDRLAEYLYSHDVFDERNPVFGSRFFGRQADLQELRYRTLNAEHVGLLGLRKIGKTSLLRTYQRLAPTFGDVGDVVVAVYIDLQALPHDRLASWLLWRIGRDLVRVWRADPRRRSRRRPKFRLFANEEPPSDSRTQSYFGLDLERLVGDIAGDGFRPHIVMLIDEVELLFPPADGDTFPEATSIAQILRGLTQQGLPLSVVWTGSNAHFSERPRFGDADNPLLNFVSKQYLAPLSHDEMREMVKSLGGRMGLKFQHEALELMYEQAGGHPFVTRQLGSAIGAQAGRSRPHTVTRTSVERTLKTFVADHHETFRQILDSLRFFPDERYLLERLATGEARDRDFVLEWTRAAPADRQHLQGYGLVVGAGADVTIGIPLIAEYLNATAGR